MFDAVTPRQFVPLMQSPGYGRAARILGLAVEEIAFEQQGLRAGHALMQSRWVPLLGWIGLISRGPLWTDVPDAELFGRTLAHLGHPVVVNADGMLAHDLSRAGLVRVMSAASIAQLDLTGGPHARRARMHQKWRNCLVKAEGTGMKVLRDPLPPEPRHWLLLAEAEQRRARRYKGLPPAFAAGFVQANPGFAQVFTAYHRGENVAAMLFLQHGASATCYIDHTTEAGRKVNAQTLLLAQAGDWLAENGVDMIDLGMVDTVNAPDLARFKLGAGAAVRKLGGTWIYGRWLAPFARLGR